MRVLVGCVRRLAGLRPALVASALVALALTSCGGQQQHASTGSVVSVTERDFKISLGSTQVSSGDVVLRVHNGGPDQHELIVVPETGQSVPLRGDGFTVDEETLQKSEPGALEPQRPGGTRDLRVQLKPGRYILFCNMAGHYLSGMHTELVVTS